MVMQEGKQQLMLPAIGVELLPEQVRSSITELQRPADDHTKQVCYTKCNLEVERKRLCHQRALCELQTRPESNHRPPAILQVLHQSVIQLLDHAGQSTLARRDLHLMCLPYHERERVDRFITLL